MKRRLSGRLFFLSFERNTDVPARKTNIGAQRYVIHRVKKSRGVVVERSVGLEEIEDRCNRSRTWSRAMMIIAIPRVKSMLLILFCNASFFADCFQTLKVAGYKI